MVNRRVQASLAAATAIFAAAWIAAADAPAGTECPPRNPSPAKKSPFDDEPPPFMPRVEWPDTLVPGQSIPAPPVRQFISLSSLTPQERETELARQARDRQRDFVKDLEDWHLAELPRELSQGSWKGKPRPELAAMLVDLSKSPLATWKLEATRPEGPTARMVTRFFSRPDGSLAALGEWDIRSDGGSVMHLEGDDNARVGTWLARNFSFRGPGGCVSTRLSWTTEARRYTLRYVGPLRLGEQRALLGEMAASIDEADRQATTKRH